MMSPFPQIHTTLSILISSKQQFKPEIQHMLQYPKDTATKHFIIRTESWKFILPGWKFWPKQHEFPHDLLVPNILNSAARATFHIPTML